MMVQRNPLYPSLTVLTLLILTPIPNRRSSGSRITTAATPTYLLGELYGKLREDKAYSRHPGSLYRVFVRLGFRKKVESTKKKSLRRTIKIYVQGTSFPREKNVCFWRIHRVLGGCKGFFKKMNEFPKKFTICYSFKQKIMV